MNKFFIIYRFFRYDAEDHEAEEDSDADEEVNGNEDDSEEEDDSSEEGDDLDDSVGLEAVYSGNLDEMSDEGDYEAVEEEEDEDGIEEEEDEDGEGEEASEQSPEGKSITIIKTLFSVFFLLMRRLFRTFSIISSTCYLVCLFFIAWNLKYFVCCFSVKG